MGNWEWVIPGVMAPEMLGCTWWGEAGQRAAGTLLRRRMRE